MKSCVLICESCKKETSYSVGKENTCQSCGRELIIEKGIEHLVVAFNTIGIKTDRSSDGHDGDFDLGIRYYPWITLIDESIENICYVEGLLNEYNEEIGKKKDAEWIITIEKVTEGKRLWRNHKWFIIPKHKERNAEILQKEADMLAKFLIEYYAFSYIKG